MSSPPAPSRFLSGSSGEPHRGARLYDRMLDARIARAGPRLDELAAAVPERDVLVLSVYRGDGGLLPAAVEELRDSRHRLHLSLGSMDAAAPALADDTVATDLSGGKFANLNALLPQTGQGTVPYYKPARVSAPKGVSAVKDGAGGPAAAAADPAAAAGPDWLLVVDDDVELPRRFLDRLIGVAEHHELALAQPAQSLASHAAWPVTRRRRGALLRESRFVEIGPVTLFRRDAVETLTPFPPLRYGWGLDLHWAAVAQERGWRLGIVDSLAVRHESARVAATYSSREAIEEAQQFLADRPFLESDAVQETVRVHRLR